MDPALSQLWGNPLTHRDIQISEALEWAAYADCGMWERTEYAGRFKGENYLGGRLPRLNCDQALFDFVDRYALVPLDPFFQNARDDTLLRVMLTLATLVMQGHAKYEASACERYFTAVADLPYRFWPTEREGLVPDLILTGKCCAFLNIAGDEFVVAPTAADMLCNPTKEDLTDKRFRKLLLHLETVGLMRRKKTRTGLGVWKPTEDGRRLGFASRTLPIGCVLHGLDLQDLILDGEETPTWWGVPSSKAGMTAWSDTTDADDAEWAFDRPLFLIRPTKHRHVVSPYYRP